MSPEAGQDDAPPCTFIHTASEFPLSTGLLVGIGLLSCLDHYIAILLSTTTAPLCIPAGDCSRTLFLHIPLLETFAVDSSLLPGVTAHDREERKNEKDGGAAGIWGGRRPGATQNRGVCSLRKMVRGSRLVR